MTPGPETASALHPWLAAFRPQDQPMIRAWFAYGLSKAVARPRASSSSSVGSCPPSWRGP